MSSVIEVSRADPVNSVDSADSTPVVGVDDAGVVVVVAVVWAVVTLR